MENPESKKTKDIPRYMIRSTKSLPLKNTLNYDNSKISTESAPYEPDCRNMKKTKEAELRTKREER